MVYLFVFVCMVLSHGCSAPAPAPQGRELIEGPVRLELGVHRYWGEGVEIEVPEALAPDFDAEPLWVAHVEGGVDYELWPGGVRAESERPRFGARVVGWDAERGAVRVRVSDGLLTYFPGVERGSLMGQVTNQPTVIYNARGLPFGRFPRAQRLEPARGGVEDDRLAYVCLGGEDCWGRGYVKRSQLGDILPIASEVDAMLGDEPRPEVLLTVGVPEGREITLYDDVREPTVSGRFDTLDVLERGDPWTLVSTYHDGVELYGYVSTGELTEIEDMDLMSGMLGGMGMLGRGTGGGGYIGTVVRLRKGAWVHGAPASAAIFARVDADRVLLNTEPNDAVGWTSGSMRTPWGAFTVYVRDEDVAGQVHPR